MSFTPEEIANRVFTPSAEGYHQGEVRDFLQRVAREMRNLHAAYSAQSGQSGPLVPLPGAAAAKSTADAASTDEAARLAAVSDRIEALVAQLEGAVAQAAPTSPSAAAPSTTQAVADTAHASTPTIAPIEVGSTPPVAAPPPPAATPAATAAPAPVAATAQPATEWNGIDGPTYIERVPIAIEDASAKPLVATETATTPLPRVPAEKLTQSVGAISPTDPMFSDSANDLLDGVLDDVMDSLE